MGRLSSSFELSFFLIASESAQATDTVMMEEKP